MREVNQPSKDLGHCLDVTHKEKKKMSHRRFQGFGQSILINHVPLTKSGTSRGSQAFCLRSYVERHTAPFGSVSQLKEFLLGFFFFFFVLEIACFNLP